jgi:hypothetical protein
MRNKKLQPFEENRKLKNNLPILRRTQKIHKRKIQKRKILHGHGRQWTTGENAFPSSMMNLFLFLGEMKVLWKI